MTIVEAYILGMVTAPFGFVVGAIIYFCGKNAYNKLFGEYEE